MALTNGQKNKILYWLGYPGKSLDVGSVLYDKVLSDRLVSLNADTEALVKVLMDKIAALDEKMEQAQCRMATESVGDIKLNSNNEIHLLKGERKRLIKELSVHLDIPYRGSSNQSQVVC